MFAADIKSHYVPALWKCYSQGPKGMIHFCTCIYVCSCKEHLQENFVKEKVLRKTHLLSAFVNQEISTKCYFASLHTQYQEMTIFDFLAAK